MKLSEASDKEANFNLVTIQVERRRSSSTKHLITTKAMQVNKHKVNKNGYLSEVSKNSKGLTN